jgi:hypothetical protein
MASIESQVRLACVTFLLLGESRYNDVLRRYEIFLMPINTTKEGSLKITCDDVNIYGSPFTIDIIPGPCMVNLLIFSYRQPKSE